MPEIEYIWDELSDNVAAEYEDGVLKVGYTHEPGLYGSLLSQNRNGVTSYYHYDGRGDTVALTDDSGNVTDTKEYDAWGNVIASTGSTATPYQFGGRQGYQTGITGVYVRARLYQPTLGRFTVSSIQLFSPAIVKEAINPYVFDSEKKDILIDPWPKELPQSLAKTLATTKLPCTTDEPCPCTNSDDGCTFVAELRSSLYSRVPFRVADLELILSFTPIIPLKVPPVQAPPNRPITDCFGDYGRVGEGFIEVKTSDGITCRYTKSNFNDPGGYPEESTIPEDCRFIYALSHGSRPPRGKPPYHKAGSKIGFSKDLVYLKMRFEIETYCGCGEFDELSRPQNRATGTLSVDVTLE